MNSHGGGGPSARSVASGKSMTSRETDSNLNTAQMSNSNSFRIAWRDGDKTFEEKPHIKYVLNAMKSNFNPALKDVSEPLDVDKTNSCVSKSNSQHAKTTVESKNFKKSTSSNISEASIDQKGGKKCSSACTSIDADNNADKKSNITLSKSNLLEGTEDTKGVKKVVVTKGNLDSNLDIKSSKKDAVLVKNNSSECVVDKKNNIKRDLSSIKIPVKTAEIGNVIIKAEGNKKKSDKKSEGADVDSEAMHMSDIDLTTALAAKEDQFDAKISNSDKATPSSESSSSSPKISFTDNENNEEHKKRFARKRQSRNRSASRSEGGSEGDFSMNGPKRSARRWSKEGESVLQNAIARKEKSLSAIGKSDDDKSFKAALIRSTRETKTSFSVGKRSQSKSQDSMLVRSEMSLDSKVKTPLLPKLPRAENNSEISKGLIEVKDLEEAKGGAVFGNHEASSGMSSKSPSSKQEGEVSCGYTKTGKRRYKPFRGLRYSFSGVTKRTKVIRRSAPQQRSNDFSLKKVASNLNTRSEKGSLQKVVNGIRTGKDRSNSPALADACTSKAKKNRREDPLSPSPSPGDTPSAANPPESTAISFGAGTAGLCLCQSKSNFYALKEAFEESDAGSMCQAVDCLEDRLIGCCNAVGGTESARLYRPSPRVPYFVVCEQHRQRLLRHHCCPGCGHYCTQGRFVQCPSQHYYHRDCQLLISGRPQCPHCGLDSPPDEVSISLGVKKYPVFLPQQKLVKKTPSARMTLASNKVTTETPESKPVGIAMTLPITTAVLDKGEREKLEKFMSGACSVRSEGRSAHLPRFSMKHLYQAAKAGDSEKIVGIMRNGINPNHCYREINMRTALHAAAEKGHVLTVHVLVQAGGQLDPQDSDLMTPLMYASLNNHIRIVQYLVKAGACVTHQGSDGMTALHIAAKQGHLDICHCLLLNGKAPVGYVNMKDDGGWTALVWSCEFRHATVARYLLENRADPLLRDSEQNIALHWAAYSGSEEISERLLNYGSDVNCLNIHGDSPLHVAARQDNLQCVLLFLSRGAKPEIVNKLGQQALDCAIDGGDCYNSINTTSELRKMTKSAKERTNKILTNDMTLGKEENGIQCLNAVDDETEPRDYVYVTENCFTSNIHVDRTITTLQSCECQDSCNGSCCKCTLLSLRSWYDSEGKLLPEFNFFDPPMLFECNELCSCNVKLCKNRVVQRGLRVRFQLFRTVGKGWGVRTLTSIPKGTYVCEYIGEIISDCEADQRQDDSYLFDLDNREGETYCIDACRYGNIARFINHMCAPNLQPVRVFMGHHDLRFPRIAFFANRDIQPQEELGFDYGDKFWIIKYKSFTCTCGASNCKYSETTIKQTLVEYRNKQEEDTTAS